MKTIPRLIKEKVDIEYCRRVEQFSACTIYQGGQYYDTQDKRKLPFTYSDKPQIRFISVDVEPQPELTINSGWEWSSSCGNLKLKGFQFAKDFASMMRRKAPISIGDQIILQEEWWVVKSPYCLHPLVEPLTVKGFECELIEAPFCHEPVMSMQTTWKFIYEMELIK